MSAEKIQPRMRELAEQVSAVYPCQDVDLVCLAHNTMSSTADLVRHIIVPVAQQALAFSPYPQVSSSRGMCLALDGAEPVQDRHVLLTEELVDRRPHPSVSDEPAAPAPACES